LPLLRQQRLKAAAVTAASAWAWVVVAEFLDKLNVASAEGPVAAGFDAGFRWEAAAAFAHRLERSRRPR